MFYWCNETEEAFLSFTSSPILSHPGHTEAFTLENVTSSYAVRAILSQRNGTDNGLHPVAYMSKRLPDANVNYPIQDNELLAIKLAQQT